MRTLPLLLIAGLTLLSCSHDELILGGDQTMGDISDGVFTSDGGLRYNVASQSCEGDLASMDRSFIVCDILRKRSDKEYDIHLRQISPVLRKEPLTAAGADPAVIGSDPIGISSAWMGGRYINLSVVIAFKKESSVSHVINLVLEDPAAADTLRFRLHHNGFGEVYGSEDDSKISTGAAYVSFPATQFLSGKEQMPVKITSDWYYRKDDGSLGVSERSIKGTLQKN